MGFLVNIEMQFPGMQKNLLVVLVLTLIYVFGLNLTGINHFFSTNDAGLYSLISKNMLATNDFASLIVDHKPWLDKPHFQFWITAFFFKFFGESPFVYRLTSLIFFVLGGFYTFRLAKKYADEKVAWLSLIVLLSTLHIVISNEQVRAETMLIGLVVPSMFYMMKLYEEFSFKTVLFAAFFSACAWMTKGTVALIPSVFGVLIFIVITKDWKQILDKRWLLFGVFTLVFLLPEVISLQMQFGDETSTWESIRWFLWDSQFGRFMGEGRITRTPSNPLEFLINFAWASLPWLILIFSSVFWFIKNRLVLTSRSYLLLIPILGSTFNLVVFAISKFQLPYYTNILFPFFSIGVAYFVVKNDYFRLYKIQYMMIALIGILYFVALHFMHQLVWAIAFGIFICALLFLVYRLIKEASVRLILVSSLASVSVFSTINYFYYQERIKWTDDYRIANFINAKYPKEKLTFFDLQQVKYALPFHLKIPYSIVKIDSLDIQKHPLVLTQFDNIRYLHWQDIGVDTVAKWDYLVAEQIELDLFNEKEKSQSEQLVLLRLYSKY